MRVSGCAGCEMINGEVFEYDIYLTMALVFGFTKFNTDFIVKVIKEAFHEIEAEYL